MRFGVGLMQVANFAGIAATQRALLAGMASIPTADEFVCFGTAPDLEFVPTFPNFSRRLVPEGQFPVPADLERIDLFHGLSYVIPPTRCCRTVVTIHDTLMLSNIDQLPDEIVGPNQHMIRLCAGLADRVITASHYALDCILHDLHVPKDRIDVVYNGILPAFRKNDDHVLITEGFRRLGVTPPYILYVGGVRPRKNLKTLLRAFATVRKEYGQPISLVIVNGLVQDAPAPDLLQAWPDELGPLAVASGRRVQCASNVTITGPIDTDELVGFYSLSEMVVYPSLAEGFGLPPLEAMACGAPVVASNATALPEVLGDAAMLIDPLDYHGFSRAMLRILRESDLALDLRAKGAAHARRYSAERAAMETMDVYAKTMATPARGALRQHASDRCR